MHEVLHSMRNIKNPTVVIKLDMEKEYDRVSWIFLDMILDSFRFGQIWRHWVMECISSLMFLVIINGEVTSFFKSQRGIRLGDPVSPYLFSIMIEALRRMIKQARIEENIFGIVLAPDCEATTHHKFVDDTIFIRRAKTREVVSLKNILNLYEKDSHQKIEIQKTKVYLLNYFEAVKKNSLNSRVEKLNIYLLGI